MMLYSVLNGDLTMRTTISLDDDLVAAAQKYTGIKEKAALVHEALKALVAREASRRLASLGGSDPDATAPPRRRFPPE
jgi:Arc/MetJ family transcription regulator